MITLITILALTAVISLVGVVTLFLKDYKQRQSTQKLEWLFSHPPKLKVGQDINFQMYGRSPLGIVKQHKGKISKININRYEYSGGYYRTYEYINGEAIGQFMESDYEFRIVPSNAKRSK